MAIVNKGFPGTVNATYYAKSWYGGGSHACSGTGWLVTQGTGRQTSTAAGDAFAVGIISENSAPILTSLSTPTNGQWFLIVRRIDWSASGTVTVAAVAHTTTSTTIPVAAPSTFPTINESPGVLFDHKLAWAWVRSTDTTMVLFDLRELPLEPRMQVAETSIATNTTNVAALLAGAGRGTRANLAPVATLDDVAAVAGMLEGDWMHVDEGDFYVAYVDGAWKQISPARVADATARDTIFARASNAYKVQGARSIRADWNVTEEYSAIYATPANLNGRDAAGWYPVDVNIQRLYTPNVTATAVASGTAISTLTIRRRSYKQRIVMTAMGQATTVSATAFVLQFTPTTGGSAVQNPTRTNVNLAAGTASVYATSAVIEIAAGTGTDVTITLVLGTGAGNGTFNGVLEARILVEGEW